MERRNNLYTHPPGRVPVCAFAPAGAAGRMRHRSRWRAVGRARGATRGARASMLCVSAEGLRSGSWKKSYSNDASARCSGASNASRAASLPQSAPKKPCRAARGTHASDSPIRIAGRAGAKGQPYVLPADGGGGGARHVAEAGARAIGQVLAGAAAGAVERAAVLGDAEREAAVVRVVAVNADKVPACTAARPRRRLTFSTALGCAAAAPKQRLPRPRGAAAETRL